MKINECYDLSCDKENLSCLLDCHSMLENILLLRNIHNKVKEYDEKSNKETDKHIYTLNNNFQSKFRKLCNDYIAEYDKVINEYSPNPPIK